MKKPFVERLLNRLLKKKEIVNCEHSIYLHRWYLFSCRWFAIFIHKFVRSDEDRALHDHPWNFLVIPIWRGYIEHNERWKPMPGYQYNPCTLQPNTTRVLPLLHTRYRRAEYRHRVELIDGRPSWSIFVRFRKRREWGFWDKARGFIQWAKWWRDNKCE